MLPNFLVLAICAFIPMITGIFYFHTNVMGKLFQAEINSKTDSFTPNLQWYHWLFQFILYFLLAFGVYLITVHHTHVLALTGPDIAAFKTGTAAAFMAEYGGNFRTFEHGISHGLVIGTLFFALPIMARVTIYEGKSLKYLLIYSLYWGINLILMACIISKWGSIEV